MNSNINDKIVETINIIIKENDDEVVFGGSFVLNLLGLINRPIKDLDLIYGRLLAPKIMDPQNPLPIPLKRPLLYSKQLKIIKNNSGDFSERCIEEDGSEVGRIKCEME